MASKPPEPLRFAHPFYITGPAAAERAPVPPFGTRMLDHIETKLERIPQSRGNARLQLSDVIGAQGEADIAAAGEIVIHTCGDTGKGDHSPQSDVADAMAGEYDLAAPGHSPAFFLHLGDVIYGHSKDLLYRDQFYTPYRHYPGKIVAIAGNHDGEVYPGTDPETLRAFSANFTDPNPHVPDIAGSVFRQTMNLPGVYWLLDGPFVQIVGLYSNVAENPGFISGPEAGDVQKKWLGETLKALREEREGGSRKGLVFATHHPPFSSAGHSGSLEMLAEIDGLCRDAGIWPDLFLSGHSHCYQRYTRTLQAGAGEKEIPFIVAGGGGHGITKIGPARGEVIGDHRFEASYAGFGYARVTVAPGRISVEFIAVDGADKKSLDRVAVNLATGRLIRRGNGR